MIKKFSFTGLLLSLMLGLSAIAFGQQTGGSIEGTVKDPQGAVVPGVSVTVTGINVGFTRTVTTDDQGTYHIQQVPPGTYRLTTSAGKGFGAYNNDNVTVVIEKVTTADIALNVAGTGATVDVTSDPTGVVVDSTDSKIQTNVTTQLIQGLPKSQGFASVIRAAPGANFNGQLTSGNGSETGYLQIDGASGSENAFLIDGQEVTNFRSATLYRLYNIPTSLVQEVQIKTSGFEAEHGGASGGVIVVGTKSGTDQWRGEFGAMFEPSKLQPNPRTFAPVVVRHSSGLLEQATYSLQQPKDASLRFDPTATFGGPIKKGRIWFIGSYSPSIYTATRTVNYFNSPVYNNTSTSRSNGQPAQTFQGTQRSEYAFGRVDAAVSNNLRVFASYLWNPAIFDGFGGQYFPAFPQSAITFGVPLCQTPTGPCGSDYQRLTGGRTNSNNFSTQGTWTPNQKAVLSLRYGRSFLNEKGGSAYGIPASNRIACGGVASAYPAGTVCAAGFANIATNNVVNKDVSVRNTFNVDLNYLIGNFGGSHNIKGGYEYGRVLNDVNRGYAALGQTTLYYGYAAADFGYADSFCDPATCIGIGEMIRFGTQGKAQNRYNGLYIQDKWQPFRRLTLNLGVRAENENLPSFNTGSGGSTGSASGATPFKFGWGDKIAPRLGGSFDVKGDGKSRIFASYGKFFDRLKFELPRGSFGGDFYRIDDFPMFASHPEYTYYTYSRILGTWANPIGGGNPSTAGGIAKIEYDYRIPSNLTLAQYTALGLPAGGIDPNLKPFTQVEFTAGYEQEFWSNYVFQGRFTHKWVTDAIEDQANLGLAESENYIIGNVGTGFAFQQRQAAGYAKQTKVERDYKAFEFTLDRRLTSSYYYNLSYTYSRLRGNYSGLASSDENGRASPGVNRFFDYAVNGYTATGAPDNGLLATDRPHVFKAYGAYIMDWGKHDWLGMGKNNSTELGFFQTIQSGTPQTTFIGIASTSIPLTVRGDLGRTPTFWQTDLNLQHSYKFGRDNRFQLIGEINVLNVFNQDIVTALNTPKYLRKNTLGGVDLDPCYVQDPTDPSIPTGCTASNHLLTTALNNVLNGKINAVGLLDAVSKNKSMTYGAPAAFQAPRNIRFGMRLRF